MRSRHSSARRSDAALYTRILRVAGLGESTVEERLGALVRETNPTVATYAKRDAVDVRVTAKAATEEDARALVDQMDARIRGELGESVFGIDSETLSNVALKLMTERKLFLGTMESCTGGLLASLLTDTPGVSTMFRGGLVSYATDLKEEWGVPREVVERHGVISVETARAMAQAARERLRADIGVGVTGVAGPDTQEDKPVGTVHIAVASADWVRDTSQRFNGGRAEIKWRAAQTALNLLRLSLLRTQ